MGRLCAPTSSLAYQRGRPNAHPVGQRDHHVNRRIKPSSFESLDLVCADVGPCGEVSDADSLPLAYLPELLFRSGSTQLACSWLPLVSSCGSGARQ
jgi:hypothetical protein